VRSLIRAAKEKIWPYYADPVKRRVWEEDLESLVLDGEAATGTRGLMKLKGMPEMAFTLEEYVVGSSFRERVEIPGKGALLFGHEIIEEGDRTLVRHSVRMDKDPVSGEDSRFLAGVFSDFPDAILKIKAEAER
jgi:hypothetical protein